jgi:hypothetical protein
MGFMCINGGIECDGCMDCKPDPHYYCPVCGEEVCEAVFVDKDGDVIGCECCAEMKSPHEVFEDETD